LIAEPDSARPEAKTAWKARIEIAAIARRDSIGTIRAEAVGCVASGAALGVVRMISSSGPPVAHREPHRQLQRNIASTATMQL